LTAVVAIGLASHFAQAAPASAVAVPAGAASAPLSGDTLSRLLADKGLVSSEAAVATPTDSPFVDRVRDKASDMVATAMNFLGVPYRRGGESAERGFDCSGFTRQVFESSLGFMLPRRADEQAKAPGLIEIMRNELQPGDLVFFNTLRRTFSHVGIYIGDGKFVHAPRPGGEVRVEDMRFSYWAKRFTGARRAEPIDDQAAADANAPAAPISATAKAPAIR
jgi:cell wall-associated NlpC family hydrolase